MKKIIKIRLGMSRTIDVMYVILNGSYIDTIEDQQGNKSQFATRVVSTIVVLVLEQLIEKVLQAKLADDFEAAREEERFMLDFLINQMHFLMIDDMFKVQKLIREAVR